MKVESINYQAGSVAGKGTLIYDQSTKGRRPLLLISPNWLGISEATIKRVTCAAVIHCFHC